jgi:hypothetical protein
MLYRKATLAEWGDVAEITETGVFVPVEATDRICVAHDTFVSDAITGITKCWESAGRNDPCEWVPVVRVEE